VDANTGLISTVAGNGTAGFSGDGGPATSASLNDPAGVAVDSLGNLFISDWANERVRKVDANTGFISTVAGNGTEGFSGDGGPATSASLNDPTGVAVDSLGNLYIGEQDNERVRKVDANTGLISTVAGDGTKGFSGDGGPATSASLYEPSGVAVDSLGNLFIADSINHRIRKVDANTGIISTVAGNGTLGFGGDVGPATSASLNYPFGVALDSAGNFFIADNENHRLRKVEALRAISIHTLDDADPDDNDGVNPSITFNDLIPGSYTVTEIDPGSLGYSLTNLVCVDSDGQGIPSTVDLNSRTATINLDPGETVTVTFTNFHNVILDPSIKTDSLFIDADGNGLVNTGDTLLYEVTIWNEGVVDATGVVFTDTPDSNTSLVVGSVSTSKGTVPEGNNTGDTSVEVSIGTVLAGGPATETVNISFQVTINDLLSPGVYQVCNQGTIESNESLSVVTDDPDTPANNDPTCTSLMRPPIHHVPTLSQSGIIGMGILLAVALIWSVRRRRVVSATNS